MSKGYVYILSNPSMPGILKIGKTTRTVEQRCNELWQTGVPTPFEIVAEVMTPNCHKLEAWVHAEIADLRLSFSREFFSIGEREASLLLNEGLAEQLYEAIDEYAPGYVLVDSDHMVDGENVNRLAHHMGVVPLAVTKAIDLLTPEELAPAMARLREAQASRDVQK